MPTSSGGVELDRITKGQRNTGVWVSRTVSAIAWCCCHLASHWPWPAVQTICTARSRSSAGYGFLDTMNPNFPGSQPPRNPGQSTIRKRAIFGSRRRPRSAASSSHRSASRIGRTHPKPAPIALKTREGLTAAASFGGLRQAVNLAAGLINYTGGQVQGRDRTIGPALGALKIMPSVPILAKHEQPGTLASGHPTITISCGGSWPTLIGAPRKPLVRSIGMIV
jgi:hypothetical protein